MTQQDTDKLNYVLGYLAQAGQTPMGIPADECMRLASAAAVSQTSHEIQKRMLAAGSNKSLSIIAPLRSAAELQRETEFERGMDRLKTARQREPIVKISDAASGVALVVIVVAFFFLAMVLV